MVLIVGLVHLWKIQRSYQGVRAACQSSLGAPNSDAERSVSPTRAQLRFLPRKCSLAHISAHRTVSHHRSKLTQIPRTEGVLLFPVHFYASAALQVKKNNPCESVLDVGAEISVCGGSETENKRLLCFKNNPKVCVLFGFLNSLTVWKLDATNGSKSRMCRSHASTRDCCCLGMHAEV